ncbi:hypothetical protein O181_098862 [Austropuccinia psidii MF-1]|uniref:Uncharacterized protein n=1 Tax=Austropuccinia psidii MF-1 TaxID=1389203 RepID=A0A9Q3PFZ4_9BASI|nr:hypothetical protein [Austropuccinia psidii MF-1]
MAQPCHFTIIAWAKLITASISAIMDEFCIPKPPMTAPTTPRKVHANLDMLKYFEGLKQPSIPPMELMSTIPPNPNPSISNVDTKQNLGANSDQQLKSFQDLILDVMISYIIFKTQANIEELSPPNQSEQLKHPKNTKNQHFGRDEISSLIINHIPQSITLLDNQALQLDQAKKKLSEYCTHQLVKPSPPEKPVWKNLSFHLNLFFSKGMNPISDVQLVCPPSWHQLAQYITSDFLNQWEAQATVTSLLPPSQRSCLT